MFSKEFDNNINEAMFDDKIGLICQLNEYYQNRKIKIIFFFLMIIMKRNQKKLNKIFLWNKIKIKTIFY